MNFKKPVKFSKDKKIYSSKELQKINEDSLSQLENTPISSDIEKNYKLMKKIFKDCADMTFRRFSIGRGSIKCFLVHIEGITDNPDKNENIYKSMMKDEDIASIEKTKRGNDLLSIIENAVITAGEIKSAKTLKESIEQLLNGFNILFVDTATNTIAINTIKWQGRTIDKAENEVVVRGPMESFVENIKFNSVLVRRRIKTPKLKMEKHDVGKTSKTFVYISYIDGMANKKTIDTVRKKIQSVNIDALLDSSQLESYLEDNPYSPFPQVGVTQRPDSVSAALLEGRIGIFVDGSPFVLIVPTVFVHFLTASEDYYYKFYFTTFLRLIRYFTFTIALLAPSLYIALTTFHQEMIPTSLLTTIANARSQVPFPAILEALLMELMFEILREAGIRLPRPVGQAISIVGALVIGDAAVQAGLVSTPMVLVVAVTGISSFTLPGYTTATTVRLLRFVIMIAASAFGIYGIVLCVMALMIHLTSISSVGVAYMSPIVPTKFRDWKDLFIRLPKRVTDNTK